MPVCPHCGHDTTDDEARFCAACGRPIAEDQESAAESTSVLHLGGPEAEAAEAPGKPMDATTRAALPARFTRPTKGWRG